MFNYDLGVLFVLILKYFVNLLVNSPELYGIIM